MRNIKTYKQHNEEISFRNALVGGAIGAIGAAGIYGMIEDHDKANLHDTEVISSTPFKQYSLSADGEGFDLNISTDGIISASWDTREGSGKSSHTVTHNCVTIPDGVSEIWYDTKFFESGVFATGKKFSGSTNVKLSDLDIYEETKTYIIYEGKFLSSIDYIIVNKGHKDGEEFTVSDDNINKYICDDIGSDIYIFGVKSLGGGNFGGGGSGNKF